MKKRLFTLFLAAVMLAGSAVSAVSAAVTTGTKATADTEEEVFSRLDSLSQEIQYVTLTTPDGTSATFGFWITPVTDKGDRKGELVW